MDGERKSKAADSQPETVDDGAPTETLTKAVKKKYHELLKFQDLPEYLRTNEYILKHYRSDLPWKQVFSSLFSIHNETFNIWTHLIGFLLFLGLTLYTAIHLPKVVDLSILPNLEKLRSIVEENIAILGVPIPATQGRITRWPFFVFLGGAMACFLFSSTYHLLNCHSKRWHSALHQMDHTGIAILIAASFYPPIYYSFICHKTLRNMYLFGITALGTITILFSALPLFRTPAFRPIRALLFFGMGVSGIVPGVHVLFLYQDEPIAISLFHHEIVMASFYGLGAFLYASRIPERLKPGLFDLVGHSHQIFHILVVAGAYTHYRAGLLFLSWRDAVGCP